MSGMLLYHPLNDMHHCAFRILCLWQDGHSVCNNWQTLKILDFYLLFPHLLKTVRLPSPLGKEWRSKLNHINRNYEQITAPKRVFHELGIIQEQAVKSLAAKGLVDIEKLDQGEIDVVENLIPKEIKTKILNAEFRNEFWYEFIISGLSIIKYEGKDGLKGRSGLMEFRYDPI